MKKINKLFFVVSMCVAAACALHSSAASASWLSPATKDWQGSQPMFDIRAKDGFEFKVNYSYSIHQTSATSMTKSDTTLSGVPGHVAEKLLNTFAVKPDQTLSFKQLNFVGKKGGYLNNCQLVENPRFIPGAAIVHITVSETGCEIG